MVGYNSASATPGGGGKSDAPTSGTNTMDEKAMPKDGRAIISILKDMGITDFEPRVVSQLLEFSYRYISTILEDARTFSVHARKKGVDLDDVKLAVEMHSGGDPSRPDRTRNESSIWGEGGGGGERPILVLFGTCNVVALLMQHCPPPYAVRSTAR